MGIRFDLEPSLNSGFRLGITPECRVRFDQIPNHGDIAWIQMVSFPSSQSRRPNAPAGG